MLSLYIFQNVSCVSGNGSQNKGNNMSSLEQYNFVLDPKEWDDPLDILVLGAKMWWVHIGNMCCCLIIFGSAQMIYP